MATDTDERRGFVPSESGRRVSPREVLYADCEEFTGASTCESAAAHERAVVTVKLTLLLLAVGIILFLFDGLGSAHAFGQKRGGLVEYIRSL